jgi:hypothetical protein
MASWIVPFTLRCSSSASCRTSSYIAGVTRTDTHLTTLFPFLGTRTVYSTCGNLCGLFPHCSHTISYTRRVKNESPQVVKCRLYVDGKVIEFDVPGPLVAMPVQSKKGKGGMKDGR